MSLEETNSLDNEESGAGHAEQNEEVFREQQQRRQQARQALQKAEAKARQKEEQLAQVLTALLQNQNSRTNLLLVARCLAQNIPAGFLLGILALTEELAQKEFANVLDRSIKLLTPNENYSAPEPAKKGFPLEGQTALRLWEQGLLEFGLTQPIRLLTTAVSPEKKIFPSLLHLTAFTLRAFLEQRKVEFVFANLQNFGRVFLEKIFKEISQRLAQVKQLESRQPH